MVAGWTHGRAEVLCLECLLGDLFPLFQLSVDWTELTVTLNYSVDLLELIFDLFIWSACINTTLLITSIIICGVVLFCNLTPRWTYISRVGGDLAFHRKQLDRWHLIDHLSLDVPSADLQLASELDWFLVHRAFCVVASDCVIMKAVRFIFGGVERGKWLQTFNRRDFHLYGSTRVDGLELLSLSFGQDLVGW